MAFPESLDPTSPAGLDSPRLGDDQIRALKQFLADLFGIVVSPTTIAAACGSIASTGKFTITSGAWNGDPISLTSYVIGILGSANGGTGNGFTKFSGPATSEKTFTLPNASDTIATLGRFNIFIATQAISIDSMSSVPNHLTIEGSTDTNRQLILGYNTTSDYGSIQSIHQGVSGTPLVLQLAGGNVGIGTTTPTTKLHVVGLPIYANNAAAIAGGLTAGAFYRTGADPDPVCVVH